MNVKTVDKTKKSNIKCEHCQYWDKEHRKTVYHTVRNMPHLPVDLPTCVLTGEAKNYYQRCKNFEWNERYSDADSN